MLEGLVDYELQILKGAGFSVDLDEFDPNDGDLCIYGQNVGSSHDDHYQFKLMHDIPLLFDNWEYCSVNSDPEYNLTAFEIWSTENWKDNKEIVIAKLKEFDLVEDKFEDWYQEHGKQLKISKTSLKKAFEAGLNYGKRTA